MTEIQVLSEIINTSPSVDMLRMRHRELLILFLYKTFYRTREPVVYETLRLKLVDYLAQTDFDADDENDINTFDSIDDKATKYITRWTDKGFLRNYQVENGEVYYELSSYASKTIDWLLSLKREEFVGTESKFKHLYHQLEELVEFTNEDASERIAILEAKKSEIEKQIDELRTGGNATVYEEYQVLPRFRQLTQEAKELLSDFKEVEDNFKTITKTIYQKHMEKDVSKGDILGFTFGALKKLQESPQGKSFYAFWDFLMSTALQEKWDNMVGQLYDSLDGKQMKQDDLFLLNINKYLYNSGRKVYRANDKMAEKLSRIICETENTQNKTTQKVIKEVQALLIEVQKKNVKPEVSLSVDLMPEIFLPLERRLTLEKSVAIDYTTTMEMADNNIGHAESADRLFEQQGIDRNLLRERIRKAIARRRQTTLPEIIAANGGLQQGLGELFGYISVAGEFRHHISADRRQTIHFNQEEKKTIIIPEIIILK